MSGKLDRLRKDERWWAAEFVLRGLGLAAFTACWRVAVFAHRLVTAPPGHQPTVGEFAACAATFLLLISGLVLTFEGPGLFRHVPISGRSGYFEDYIS